MINFYIHVTFNAVVLHQCIASSGYFFVKSMWNLGSFHVYWDR